MTEIARPTTIRRTVAFSQAVAQGKTQVEDVTARLCQVEDVAGVLAAGEIPVLVDPEAAAISVLKPQVVVDAILAKKNLGTAITDAPVVIGVGPGFTAGVDCHARGGDHARPHPGAGDLEGLCPAQHQHSPASSAALPVSGYSAPRRTEIFHPVFRDRAHWSKPETWPDMWAKKAMVCTIDGRAAGVFCRRTRRFAKA